MSVCGQTEEDSVSEETVGAAAARDLYEQKAAGKVVRVLTVLAYLLSVSLAAILLSVYYVCVWRAPTLPLLNDTEDNQLSALRGTLEDYHHNATNGSGGGNITVSDADFPPANLTGLPTTVDSEPTPGTTAPAAALNLTDRIVNLTTVGINITTNNVNLAAGTVKKTTTSVNHGAPIELDDT